ncbi:hypothetical protein Acr_29g0009300 [Actinidia rufa]|uniref:J domain-containing protein n=1 Tax=Actinidia rufa TaxID=165716 RepID=A0A7J0HFE7_9ERIC|nr:hypothetical protein Acr_29g0009300 [Actinidia rufa]
MGRLREEPDLKSQLVTEICNISRRAIACGHSTSPIVDWYLILQVEENAGLEVIRKQYHKLALQLHPDKNKHPKAEVAFKLVSEAYGCLSEAKKRAEFNFQRQNSNCSECNRNRPSCCENQRRISDTEVERTGIYKKPAKFQYLQVENLPFSQAKEA